LTSIFYKKIKIFVKNRKMIDMDILSP